MAKILLTGAAGYIASHTWLALQAAGHEVVGVDNLITGDESNIAHLAGKPFTFIRQDICQPLVIDGPVDYVMNWASPASPIDYMELPFQTLDVGSYGTRNALELARQKGARFITASTSEVYGDPLEHPQKESYWGHVNPIGPRSVYEIGRAHV